MDCMDTNHSRSFKLGLVGAFNLDLVDLIFGTVQWLARTVYILVGIAALIAIWQIFAKQ